MFEVFWLFFVTQKIPQDVYEITLIISMLLSGIYLFLSFRYLGFFVFASFFLLSVVVCLRRFQSIINSERHPLNLMDFKRFFFMDVLISKIMACQRILIETLNSLDVFESNNVWPSVDAVVVEMFVQWKEKKAITITWRISANRERARERENTVPDNKNFTYQIGLFLYSICYV